MTWVVAEVLQRLPEELLEVRFTLPPAQNASGPPFEMVGVEGMALTVTETGAEVREVHPAATA